MSILPQTVAITQVVSNAIAAMKYVREVSDGSDDLELKSRINDLYNALLDVRQTALDLDEENRVLRSELSEQNKYDGPIAPHGFYFETGDNQQERPICPTCFQAQPRKIGFMSARRQLSGGVGRRCKLCDKAVFEN